MHVAIPRPRAPDGDFLGLGALDGAAAHPRQPCTVCCPGPPPTGRRFGRNGPRRWARRHTASTRWASPRGLASSGSSSRRCSIVSRTIASIASSGPSSRPLFTTGLPAGLQAARHAPTPRRGILAPCATHTPEPARLRSGRSRPERRHAPRGGRRARRRGAGRNLPRRRRDHSGGGRGRRARVLGRARVRRRPD